MPQQVACPWLASAWRLGPKIGAAIEIWWCEDPDDADGFQDWEWVDAGPAGGKLRHPRTGACARRGSTSSPRLYG